MTSSSRLITRVDSATHESQLYWIETETRQGMNVGLNGPKSLSYFANRVPSLIATEACGGSQHWARKLPAFGHEAPNLPEAFLSPP